MQLKKQLFALFFFVPLIFFSPATIAAAQIDLNKLLDSIVIIKLSNSGPEPRTEVGVGFGAGFYITENIIVTAEHVASGGELLRIISRDNLYRSFPGKILAKDNKTDLAFIWVEEKGVPLQIRTDPVTIGETVYALGHPLGIEFSVTKGIVSRKIQIPSGVQRGQHYIAGVVQIDAAINGGNSGGPILDENGKVVGLASFIASPSGGNVGLNFAIGSIHIQRILESVVKYGKMKRIRLGIGYMYLNGRFIIKEIMNEEMGALFQIEDTILSMNGVEVSNEVTFANELILKDPSSNVVFVIQRGLETIEVTVRNDQLLEEKNPSLAPSD